MIAQAEVKCSTPFGIKEGCAHPPAPYHRQAYLVLNAFRHQRGLRTRHGCKRRLRISAQRLSASKRAARTGAQRPASKRAAPTNVRALACRLRCSTPFGIKEPCRITSSSSGRLRCSTPFGIKEGCAYSGAVASGDGGSAQRLSASKRAARYRITSSSSGRLRCSTPFGIKEGCADQCQGLGLSFAVLNAFRHQRGLRLFRSSCIRRRRECSMPFGIKEGCAAVTAAAVWIVDECSTPFGIKEGCAHWSGKRGLWPTGAQRLSASKRAAHEQVGDKG